MENTQNYGRIYLNDSIKKYIREKLAPAEYSTIENMTKHVHKSRYDVSVNLSNNGSVIILKNCKVTILPDKSGMTIEYPERDVIDRLIGVDGNFVVDKKLVLDGKVSFKNLFFSHSCENDLFKALFESTSHTEHYLYEFIPEAFDFPSVDGAKLLLLKYDKCHENIYELDSITPDHFVMRNRFIAVSYFGSPLDFLFESFDFSAPRKACRNEEGLLIPDLKMIVPIY